MKSLCQLLKGVVEELKGNDHSISIRTNYGGRGMYNRSCVGITGSESVCLRAISMVYTEMMDELYSACINAESEEEMSAASDMRSKYSEYATTLLDYDRDSMGYDVIVYWPNVQWDVAEDEELE